MGSDEAEGGVVGAAVVALDQVAERLGISPADPDRQVPVARGQILRQDQLHRGHLRPGAGAVRGQTQRGYPLG